MSLIETVQHAVQSSLMFCFLLLQYFLCALIACDVVVQEWKKGREKNKRDTYMIIVVLGRKGA